MISSGDVSGIFAAQNQAMIGLSDYSSRIGLPGAGLGAIGSPSGGGVGAPFNFGPGPSYAGGNRFAGGVMSGIGAGAGVANFGANYLGLAAMLPGRIGGMLPFGAFAGTTAGAFASGGLSLVAQAGTSFVHGAQQQMAINNTLGGFGFFNPASRTGMGFTRSDASGIGSMVRQMSEIPEMMTSMQELTSIMGKLKTTGLMTGVHSATEFASRFKEAISTIRETSRILGTTMEEAEGFFAHSRSVGFLGRSDQLKNAMNTQFTSGMTGMSVGQVMGLQTAGANMATSMGGQRAVGASAFTSIAQNLGAATRNGRVSDEMIQNLTGLNGADGIAAASQQMGSVVAQMALGTAPGQFMLAGLAKFDGGKASIDQDLARRFSMGLVSVDELRKRASHLTNAQKISFAARQADLASGLAGAVGPGGISRFLGNLVGGQGSEAETLLVERFGGNAAMADLMHSMRGVDGSSQFGDFSGIRMREADIRERTSPTAVLKKMMTRFNNATAAPLETGGANLLNDLGKAAEGFWDDLVGRHVITFSKAGATAFRKAMAGGGQAGMDSMFASVDGMRTLTPNMSTKLGFMLGMNDTLSGGGTFQVKADKMFRPGFGFSDMAVASGGDEAKSAFNELRLSIKGFDKMSAREQFTALHDRIYDVTAFDPGSTGYKGNPKLREQLLAGLKSAKGGTGDSISNLVLAQSGINTARLFDSSGRAAALNANLLQDLQGKSYNKLTDAVGPTAAKAIRDNPELGAVVSKLANRDAATMEALANGDAKKLGIDPSQLSVLRDISDVVMQAEPGKLTGALTDFNQAQAAGNLNILKTAMDNAGDILFAGSEALAGEKGMKGYSGKFKEAADAFHKFGKSVDKGDFYAARKSMVELSTQIFSDSKLSDKKREKLLSLGAGLVGNIESSVRGLHGTFTEKELADQLGGISIDDLHAMGFSGDSISIGKGNINKVVAGLAGLHGADVLAQNGASNHGQSKSDALLSVLNKMDKNMMIVATLLAKQQKIDPKDINEDVKKFFPSETNS